ncbi:MAG: phage holin family protein [Muribaculaceae bacterium]|nr:phage holin family protein [Muribaculaceae bacterium]
MKLLIKFILFAAAVYFAAYFVPGIDIAGVKGAVIVSIVLGLLNTFVKPFVKLLAFPVNLLTLGLFTVVINALMVLLCEMFVPESLVVEGFMPALVYGVALVVVSWVLNFVFLKD